jgi:tetratricopeptide (TPR) repeat protein
MMIFIFSILGNTVILVLGVYYSVLSIIKLFKMKRTIFLLLLSFYSATALTQSKFVDSLKLLLQKEKQDTNRVLLLANIGGSYLFEKPETGLAYVQQGLELARTIKYKKGEATCLIAFGHLNRMIGNYTTGIRYHLEALQIFEMVNDQNGITSSYIGIAANYEDEGDYKEALSYYYKAKAAAESSRHIEQLGGLESNMGLCFLNLGQLDSALKYEQNAYELERNSSLNALVLARLGSIHAAMNNYDVALSFYRMGIPAAIANSDNNALNELYFGISTLFQEQQQFDSSIYYGKKALATAQELGNPGEAVDAGSILFTNYKKTNIIDSAFKYLELSSITKDTLLTQDKLRQQQILVLQEKSRQQEIAAELKTAAEKRKQDIQFAALAIGIISFILLFFLLSRSIIINAKWVRFLGVLALLVSFEFIDLIVHPYLSYYTDDSPLLMLSALVIIGALLIPLHHRIEKWVIEKMIEKNKRIRLTTAKKIIASIEGDVSKEDV